MKSLIIYGYVPVLKKTPTFLNSAGNIESLLSNKEFAIGFVYLVKNKVTGDKYIGKKMYFKKAKRFIGKRKRIVLVHTDWAYYSTSNKGIIDKFKKSPLDYEFSILKNCSTKKELSYFENWHLYSLNVLRDSKYLNDNISGKFFRRDLIKSNNISFTIFKKDENKDKKQDDRK